MAGKTPKIVGGPGEVDAFLRKLSLTPAPASGKRGRLIFALDATMSRQPTWDRACHIQADMFREADAVGGLDIKLVFFRGYRECKASPWYGQSAPLTRAMTSIQCQGGYTQIARVLKRASKEAREAKVNALVYVGDSCEEEIDAVCAAAGELALSGVPAFMFQEGGDPYAQSVFREVARLTGGAWCPFDGDSAGQLRELLSAVAIFAAGGRKALSDYGNRQGGEVLRLAKLVAGG
ncbi:VWA domain-containing protein [Emcibacter sp. SYSU 3D8]|uniref:VWA domain-containing protein n=1 Tax=Emcibacter sp. SYSU 3D8 TaxID=3133969 RepID=UPI0031FEB80B